MKDNIALGIVSVNYAREKEEEWHNHGEIKSRVEILSFSEAFMMTFNGRCKNLWEFQWVTVEIKWIYIQKGNEKHEKAAVLWV